MASPQSVITALALHAARTPEKRAFGFVGNDGEIERSLGYAELLGVVSAAAESYRSRGLRKADRVVVSLPAGLEFVASFLAVLAAGGVAVPLPASSGRGRAGRVGALIRQAAPHFLISAQAGPDLYRADARSLQPADLDARRYSVLSPVIDGASDDDLQDTPAYLQYTSGSTAVPRAVEVTHGMLVHNLECIRTAFEHDSTSVFVSWLPHYHDMGLIGTILQPLYCGATSYLSVPAQFIRRPLSWLQAISDRGATTSGGPNFAYELCVTALQEAAREPALDLRSWNVAFNGSEPVRAATMDRFAQAFSRFGLRRTALFPCYGMAENGLFVSGGPVGTGIVMASPTAGSIIGDYVSTGKIGEGQVVVVVDPQTRIRLNDGSVGEIWVRGRSTARRYFRNKEESATLLDARLQSGEGPFLRTGDLGFLAEQRLYVTGRLKDMIIVNGRNLYPEDIEMIALEVLPGKGRVRVAAFGVDTQASERVVLLVAGLSLHGSERHRAMLRVREALFDAIQGLNVEVLSTSRAMIPVTSSGKVRRAVCKENYLNGRIAAANHTSMPDVLRSVVEVIMGRSAQTDDMELSPLALGFDSLSLARLAEQLDQSGIAVPPGTILARLSLSEISALPPRAVAADAQSQPLERDESPPRALRASLNQQSYAFQELTAPAHPRGVLAFVVSLSGALSDLQIGEAVNLLLRRHTALSLRIRHDGTLDVGEGISVVHHRSETFDAARVLAATLVRSPMPLFDTELCRVHLISAPEAVLLALQMHHAVCDLYSLGILMDDLGIAFSGGAFPDPAPDYRAAVQAQMRYLVSPAAAEATRRWKERLRGQPVSISFPKLLSPVSRFAAEVPFLRFTIGSELAARIVAFARAQEVTIYSILLVTFGLVLSRFSRQERITIASPFHGRRFAQDAQTVGLFENLLPMALRFSSDRRFSETVQRQYEHISAMLEDGVLPLSRIQHYFSDPHALFEQGFDAMFTLQSAAGRNARALSLASLRTPNLRLDLGPLTGIVIETTEIAIEASLDLCVTAGDTIDGYLAYHPAKVSGETARRLLTAFECILAAAMDAPETLVDHLPVLGEDDRAMLERWAGGAGSPHPHRMALELFEAAAAQFPHKPAVSDERRMLSYRELNMRVDRLADRLREHKK
ncbi:AMP-binding protein [Bradyrhizobium sp. SZCCHNR1051]|uniref:AMP-binding protein n=1 Tax=Bradyrhizobium sp. SZCCHNR1051 TaxID=3057355 RepID=UPI00291671A3|nr:AMP-binding protein [Bradyrhizobium sp. SZCCHNR1051]